MRGAQRGQALILGLFVLVAGLAALFYLYNASQLVREKTRLVNTADAVAYSAGVLQARLLNFTAYNNRALLANEVLVAQLVSAAAWMPYAQGHIQAQPTVFPECADSQGAGASAGALFQYGPAYALMCYLSVQSGGLSSSALAPVLPVPEVLVGVAEGAKSRIQNALREVHQQGQTDAMRQALMQAVADANQGGPDRVRVEALPDPHMAGFLRTYAGPERVRMRELAVVASQLDPFVPNRQWDAEALLPTPECFPALTFDAYNAVRRRGGTDLIGMDEWRAVDTASFHQHQLHKGKNILPSCEKAETPLGVGEQQAHPPQADQPDHGAWLGGAASDNPIAYAQASTAHWQHYSGLPVYTDLSPAWLSAVEPRWIQAVRLSKPQGLLRTTDGQGPWSGGAANRLQAYSTRAAAGEWVAVSAVRVVFERPPAHPINTHGAPRGTPLETGSLFNPYWQARLVDASTQARWQALRQGVEVPW
jgi:Putative Flp pilus-assembly TadE/G-like